MGDQGETVLYREKDLLPITCVVSLALLMTVLSFGIPVFPRYAGSIPVFVVFVLEFWKRPFKVSVRLGELRATNLLGVCFLRIDLRSIFRVTPTGRWMSKAVEIAYAEKDQEYTVSLLCAQPNLLIEALVPIAPHIKIATLDELKRKPPEPPTPPDSSLLEEYRIKYPHSPEGVLEFHIARLRREGKTRKEAMLELKRQLGIG